MKTSALAGFAVCALVASVSANVHAVDAEVSVVFTTVDSVEIQGTVGKIVGIIEGQSTPQMRRFSAGSNVDIANQCHRVALMSLQRPGRYNFVMTSDLVFGGESFQYPKCALVRR